MTSTILPRPRGRECVDSEVPYCISNAVISLGKAIKRMPRHRGEKQNLGIARGKMTDAGADGFDANADEASLSILWISVRSTGTWYSLMETSKGSSPPRIWAERRKPLRPRAQKCLASNGSRRRQESISGAASYFQTQWPFEEASQREIRDCPEMDATIHEPPERTQQRSWTPSLAFSEGVSRSSQRTGRDRLPSCKSQTPIRPWRSPTASRRLEVEGSSTRTRSRGSGCGAHRTAVTKGASDDERGADRAGGGTESTATSCMDRGSTTTTLLPAPYARSPARLQSAHPPLSRLGGPGSTLSQEHLPVAIAVAATLPCWPDPGAAAMARHGRAVLSRPAISPPLPTI